MEEQQPQNYVQLLTLRHRESIAISARSIEDAEQLLGFIHLQGPNTEVFIYIGILSSCVLFSWFLLSSICIYDKEHFRRHLLG